MFLSTIVHVLDVPYQHLSSPKIDNHKALYLVCNSQIMLIMHELEDKIPSTALSVAWCTTQMHQLIETIQASQEHSI